MSAPEFGPKPPDPARFPTWFRVVGLVALSLLLTCFTWWPMLRAYPHTQGWEGPFMQEMLEAARVSMARWHELPLWNPYQCGGIPLWDNPQGMGATPLFWLVDAFTRDTTRGMQLWYVLNTAAGFCSLWLLVRHELGLSRGAAIVACCMWSFSGTHIQHFTGAGFQWASAFYLPLAIFCWRRAERDWRMAVGLGVVMSMMFWGGAVYPLMLTTMALAAETLTRLVEPGRYKRILPMGLLAVAVMVGLSAGRLLPVVFQSAAHKRDLGHEADALQWTTLRDMFLDRDHGRAVPGQQYVWPEYCDYVGPFLLALALFGIVMGAAEFPWLAITLAWVFLLMLGHEWSWAPWHVLKEHVYPFKDMRVPSRFNVPVNMFLAAFAGIGVDRAAKLAPLLPGGLRTRDAVRTVALALGLIGAGDMMSTGWPTIASSYNGAPIDPKVQVSPRFFIEGPQLASFVDQPQQNRGRIACWDEWAFESPSAIWTGDLPQARTTSGGARVLDVRRTQNSFVATVDAPEGARVVFNTTFDRGWRSNVGTVLRDDHLVAVDVPPGHHTMVVKYWPLGLTAGLVLTSLTIAGLLAAFVWDARRRARLPRSSV